MLPGYAKWLRGASRYTMYRISAFAELLGVPHEARIHHLRKKNTAHLRGTVGHPCPNRPPGGEVRLSRNFRASCTTHYQNSGWTVARNWTQMLQNPNKSCFLLGVDFAATYFLWQSSTCAPPNISLCVLHALPENIHLANHP